MPFDYLGLTNIVNTASPWEPGTQLSTIVQHQNIDTDLDLAFNGVSSSSFSAHGELYPGNEIWITSTPSPTELAIQVCASPRVISAETAGKLAEVLRTTVQLMSGYKDQLVSTLWDEVVGGVVTICG